MRAAAFLPALAVLVLSGCAAATAHCVVQHRYAIVVFQNGVGNDHKKIVSRFRLSVRYGPSDVQRRMIYAHIRLNAAKGNNPPIVVRTYRVGPAIRCHVDRIAAHR